VLAPHGGESLDRGVVLDALGHDVEPELMRRSIVVRRIAPSFASSAAVTNDRSILSSSTGRRFSWPSAE
jgi:hypothetical protein